jgi:hypothetical protein
VRHHPQCKLFFKKWFQLQEVGTATNAIALFASPVGGYITRSAPKLLAIDPENYTSKKRKKS